MRSRLTQRQRWMARGSGSVVLALLAWWTAGCSENARLADQALPHIEVETVQDQGLELGPDAPPKEVAYVLLRAVRDDIKAGQDPQVRKQALARQFAVCDPDYMFELYSRVFGDRGTHSRDQWVLMKVRGWAPTLAYYVGDFDFDLNTARAMMKLGPVSKQGDGLEKLVAVSFFVTDPEKVPGADVAVQILLHRHVKGHWRVFEVGFAKRRPADD